MEGLLSSSSSLGINNGGFSEPNRDQKWLLGSGFLKHGRSNNGDLEEDHDWGLVKIARTEPKTHQEPSKDSQSCSSSYCSNSSSSSLLRSNSQSLFPCGAQMLSFASSAKDESLVLSSDNALPYYQHLHYSSASSLEHSYVRNADASMNGVMARVRGPFTPTQWIELEHQALIYKYIVANAPVPTSLLLSIRRSLHPAALSPFSAFAPTALGWGSLHLGYAGNTDPEPGRCRRTDGKKWRCSRDAVPEQKYCERHINRGRHRSRKHVEARHSAPTTTSTTTTTKPSSSASASASAQPEIKGLALSIDTNSNCNSNHNPSAGQYDRILMSKDHKMNDQPHESQSLSMLTSTNQKLTDSFFQNSNKFRNNNPFDDTSPRPDFTLASTTMDSRSDRTQLSISIPVASSDFSSTSSSPNRDNLTLSPLKLSRDFNLFPSESTKGQSSWIPISWEASIGGPLGEVLNNTSNNTPRDQSKNCSSSSSLNLMTDGWDLSPKLDSSPTGVLQKMNFGSVSSSNASSPRPEIGAMCTDLLGSTIVKSQSISLL